MYESTFGEHIRRVDEVLRRIKEAGLKLKPEKCQLWGTQGMKVGICLTQTQVMWELVLC